MIVDAHNDLLLDLVLRAHEPNPFRERWLPQLRAGGVALQVCPVFVAEDPREEQRSRAFAQVEAFERAVRENAHDIFHVRAREDVERLGEGIGLLLSLEGVEALGEDAAAFAPLWERGVRMASLTWNHANAFAGGIETPELGLSDAGRALVRRLGELGVVIDLAHASERTFAEVLEAAPSAQVVVSHACCRAVNDHPRNVSDGQLRTLAARGGVLGVMALALVVARDGATLDRYVDHVDHAVAVAGIGHVGLGADFIDQVVESELAAGKELADVTKDALVAGGGIVALPGFTGPADYPRLVERLRARGYDGDRLAAVLGGNFLRVLRRALPAARGLRRRLSLRAVAGNSAPPPTL